MLVNIYSSTYYLIVKKKILVIITIIYSLQILLFCVTSKSFFQLLIYFINYIN